MRSLLQRKICFRGDYWNKKQQQQKTFVFSKNFRNWNNFYVISFQLKQNAFCLYFSCVFFNLLLFVTVARCSFMPDYLFLGLLKRQPFTVYIQVIFKSVCIACILKCFFFCLRVPLSLKTTSHFHSISSCFKPM